MRLVCISSIICLPVTMVHGISHGSQFGGGLGGCCGSCYGGCCCCSGCFSGNYSSCHGGCGGGVPVDMTPVCGLVYIVFVIVYYSMNFATMDCAFVVSVKMELAVAWANC